jgi:hypothetical protein
LLDELVVSVASRCEKIGPGRWKTNPGVLEKLALLLVAFFLHKRPYKFGVCRILGLYYHVQIFKYICAPFFEMYKRSFTHCSDRIYIYIGFLLEYIVAVATFKMFNGILPTALHD